MNRHVAVCKQNSSQWIRALSALTRCGVSHHFLSEIRRTVPIETGRSI
jgi:hypothetical protein